MTSFNPNNPGGGQGGFGSRPGLRIGPGRWGPAIKWLIITNVVVFILQMTAPLIGYFGLTPALFYTEFPNFLYQPFTYMFLHGGFGHILFNMLMLWMFGVEIEERLGLKRFLKLYFYSGLGGALAALVFDYGSLSPIVGASGAIFGVLIAYWRFFPERSVYLYFILPVKIKYLIPVMVGIGLYATMTSSGGNIAHLAHLGGAAVGFIMIRKSAKSGFISSPSWLQRMRNKRSERDHERLSAKLEKNRQQAGDVMKRVDSILDKINEVGIENISDADRKFLEDASNKLSGDKTQNH
jgi:membrane associated rhomboid family serine protease